MLLALAPADAAQFETRAGFLVAGTTPYSVAIGDFNSDGALDAAVVNDHSPSSVVILLGNGDGTFRQGATYQVNVVFSVAAASLRQNGILDLVVGGVTIPCLYCWAMETAHSSRRWRTQPLRGR
jgi:hypothetical protein